MVILNSVFPNRCLIPIPVVSRLNASKVEIEEGIERLAVLFSDIDLGPFVIRSIPK